MFEFQSLGAGLGRPKCPGLYTTSSGHWATLLVCRLTETGKNGVCSTCQKPMIASRWIACEIQHQLLADSKRNGMVGVRRRDGRWRRLNAAAGEGKSQSGDEKGTTAQYRCPAFFAPHSGSVFGMHSRG
jgi:hypothetical protein